MKKENLSVISVSLEGEPFSAVTCEKKNEVVPTLLLFRHEFESGILKCSVGSSEKSVRHDFCSMEEGKC